MLYGIVSDLHLDRRSGSEILELVRKINASDADKIIIAGDIHEDSYQRGLFFSLIKKPFFSVLGNHDFWGSRIYDDYHEDDNIAGGCLWTNFHQNPIIAYDCKVTLNDFKHIRNETNTAKVQPFDMEAIFYSQFDRIWDRDPEIIVTHFPPCLRSVHDRFRGDYYTPYFVNNLENKMGRLKAKLWVHGHVHDNFDYFMPNGMRVICNPLGYRKERASVSEYEIQLVEV